MDQLSLIKKIRQAFNQQAIDGYILPRSDRFLGEYVAECDERLAWLTGFTGSAGLLFLTKENAHLLTDSRYTIQAKSELDPKIFQVHDSAEVSLEDLIKKEGAKSIGFDPWLFNISEAKKWQDKNPKVNFKALPDWLDQFWQNRPAPPTNPILPLDIKWTGQAHEQKIKAVQKIIRQNKADGFLIYALDSAMWLLNMRGGDIPYTPFGQSFLIVMKDQVHFFIDQKKVSSALKKHLKDVIIHSEKEFLTFLKNFQGTMLCDGAKTPAMIPQLCQKTKLVSDPCQAAKAIKNKVEQDHIRQAHITDGLALTKFLYYLDTQGIGQSEMALADRLESMRRAHKDCQSLSFPTIAGSGPHGAIVHYRANKKTNRILKKNDVFLLDSGAQYLGGTTDVTRTIFIGDDKAPAHIKRTFTLVLKGHIALASAVFVAGTSGGNLDILARQFLWQNGLDYGHGTGHGVGCFLSVHEGPQSISRRSLVPLEVGMVTSNEPGYYVEGEYGIRIESLILTKQKKIAGQTRLFFETLTMAPIDPKLIDFSIITPIEKKWLHDYHKQIWKNISASLTVQEKDWLQKIIARFA